MLRTVAGGVANGLWLVVRGVARAGRVFWRLGRHWVWAMLVVSIALNGALAFSPDFSMRAGRILSNVTGLRTSGAELGESRRRAVALEHDVARVKTDARQLRGRLDASGRREMGLQKRQQALLARGAAARAALDEARRKDQLHREKVVSVRDKMASRIRRYAVANVSAAAGESLPVIGNFVVLGTTAWEMAELCILLRDLRELGDAFELPASDKMPEGVGLPDETNAWSRWCGYDMAALRDHFHSLTD